MTPRRRSARKKPLPDNLYYEDRKRGRYWRYKHPVTAVWYNWGFVPDKQAIDAAKQLNSVLCAGADLVAVVLGTDKPIKDYLPRFREVLKDRRIKGKALAEKTMTEYEQRLTVVENRLGGRPFANTTRKHVSEFLQSFPARMSNIYRSTLIQIWRHAIADGWTETNTPEQTIPRDEEVKRKPLSLDGFKAVRKHSPAWMQKAMDLALESIQGRSEVASMQWPKDGIIQMVRKKTSRYDSARIRIHVWPELQSVIDACRDDLACPYVVHRKPQRQKARKDWPKDKLHAFQVLPVDLTRAFAKARDKSEFYKALSDEERPTFHEIRALGADLKRKAGWPEEAIQALMAHTNIGMTAYYLGKHEHWVEVKAPETGQ